MPHTRGMRRLSLVPAAVLLLAAPACTSSNTPSTGGAATAPATAARARHRARVDPRGQVVSGAADLRRRDTDRPRKDRLADLSRHPRPRRRLDLDAARARRSARRPPGEARRAGLRLADRRGGRTVIATENDTVYGFDAAYRQVWKTHLGTPSPAHERPCGNVDPLGITGTPVYARRARLRRRRVRRPGTPRAGRALDDRRAGALAPQPGPPRCRDPGDAGARRADGHRRHASGCRSAGSPGTAAATRAE